MTSIQLTRENKGRANDKVTINHKYSVKKKIKMADFCDSIHPRRLCRFFLCMMGEKDTHG
jgi:hypothetical protein